MPEPAQIPPEPRLASPDPPEPRLASPDPRERRLASAGADAEPLEEVPADDAVKAPVDLGRVAWALTVLGFVIGCVVLGLRGDYGYAATAGVVALAAAINLA
jgi:hypothetical protein